MRMNICQGFFKGSFTFKKREMQKIVQKTIEDLTFELCKRGDQEIEFDDNRKAAYLKQGDAYYPDVIFYIE